MKIFSSAWADGELIPPKYTCDGANVSPPLEWADVPAGARTLALIVDDPDAPNGLFLHWLLWNIDASENGLTEGTAGGARQGRNGFGQAAYGGPCPPGGTHRYYFRLFALDSELDAPAGATRERAERAMQGHILEQAEFMGRYHRP